MFAGVGESFERLVYEVSSFDVFAWLVCAAVFEVFSYGFAGIAWRGVAQVLYERVVGLDELVHVDALFGQRQWLGFRLPCLAELIFSAWMALPVRGTMRVIRVPSFLVVEWDWFEVRHLAGFVEEDLVEVEALRLFVQ